MLPPWTQGSGDPLAVDWQARGFVGLIITPTPNGPHEYRRVGLMAPGVNKVGRGIFYQAEDVKNIILV